MFGIPHFVRNDKLRRYLRRNVLAVAEAGPRLKTLNEAKKKDLLPHCRTRTRHQEAAIQLSTVYETCGMSAKRCVSTAAASKSEWSKKQPSVLGYVTRGRCHPRMGTRKLWQEIQGLAPSRHTSATAATAFFELLRRRQDCCWENLNRSSGAPPCRAGMWRCPNLVAGLEVTRPNQVWVSDKGPIMTPNRSFGHLALVTDVYSRRIMGYDFCPTLAVEGALRALRMACRTAQGSRVG